MADDKKTDFEDLDQEPDIEGGAVPTGSAPEATIEVLGPDDIDIRFAEVDDSGKNEEGEFEQKAEREPAKGRLQREQRLKREARERADRAEAEVLRLNAENAALRKATSGDGGSDGDIEREIEAKTTQYAKIRAEFDPEKADEEAKLIRELAALEFKKHQKSGAQAPGTPSPVQQTVPAKVNPKTQDWLDRNEWFDNPDYERETRRARAIDAALYADGYRVEDGDYFEELERRLDKAGVKRPGRGNGKADAETHAVGRPRTPVVAGRVDGPTDKRSVTLTREDLAFMATCGLDPRNKAHLKEFAMNKLREERRA